MKAMAYFDYAAATPLLPEVVTAMEPYFTQIFYNPGALYLSARSVKNDIHEARATVARALGAKPNEVIFTAGGTEANNLAISGAMQQYPDAHMVISAIEHESVIQPALQYSHAVAPVDENGRIDYVRLLDLVSEKTLLISVMLANNEIGTIQDIKALVARVAAVREKRRLEGNNRPLYIHTDACQAINYLDINTARLDVDMMTINAGKIYGPKQTGALYIKSGVTLLPVLRGGGQERDLRSGTQNVANIVGFARAIQLVRQDVTQEVKRLEKLQKHIVDSIVDNRLIHLNGTRLGRRLVNNIHITIDGVDNERLLMELDERGVLIATGSACSASSEAPSHVLAAIGLSEAQSRNSVRITLGRHTTIEHCDTLIRSIKEVVAKY